VPFELVLALICRDFGWTLNELREQPAGDTLRMWLMMRKYDEATWSQRSLQK